MLAKATGMAGVTARPRTGKTNGGARQTLKDGMARVTNMPKGSVV